jgi:hypothetical protein
MYVWQTIIWEDDHEYWVDNDLEMETLIVYFKAQSKQSPGQTGESHENFNQDSR